MSLTALEFVLRATGRATLIFFSHDCPPNVYGLRHYPVAQADAQTFPSSVILNEIEVLVALTDDTSALEYRHSVCAPNTRCPLSISGLEPAGPAGCSLCSAYCSRKIIRALVRS